MEAAKDYEAFLKEVGLSEKNIQDAYDTAPDPLPKGPEERYAVRQSATHGKGTFASSQFNEGSQVAVIRVGEEWTEAGRYVNHSKFPNLKIRMDGNNLVSDAARPIAFGEELMLNYRDVRNYLKLLELGVAVKDNFCEAPEEVVGSAKDAGFDTWNPKPGRVGSGVYEGMGFWGHHALMLRPLIGVARSVVIPNSMFFRVTNTDTEEAYIHSDRLTGNHTAIVYLSEHKEKYGTEFYRYKPTGWIEMPDLLELEKEDPEMYESLKKDMVSRDPDKWEKLAFVEGKYNRAVVFPAPLFHCRFPYSGIGDNSDNGRLIWASHFFKMNGYGELY